MRMADVNVPGREGAARDPDLRVLVEFLAGMLALPLDGERVRNFLADGASRWKQRCHADNDDRNPAHRVLPSNV